MANFGNLRRYKTGYACGWRENLDTPKSNIRLDFAPAAGLGLDGNAPPELR
jgi:hypothetical protein